MNFEQFLQQKDIIPSSIAYYKREVGKYENWLQATHGKTCENAAKKDLLEYLKYVKEKRNITNATQNHILRMLKHYYSYLSKEYQVNNITCFIKIRGTNRRHLHPVFTPEELDLLCDTYYYHIQAYQPNNRELRFYPNHQKLLQGRYIALTLVAYQALRVQEIERLTYEDFDLRKATVSIRQSQAGAARKLPLEALQIGALIQYYTDGQDAPLMPARTQFQRLRESLQKLYPKFYDFRQVRSSKITHWFKLYGIRKAQHMAGHRTILATERHLTGESETLQNDMDSFHPLR